MGFNLGFKGLTSKLRNKKKCRISYNVKINVLIRYRYLPLVIAQLMNLANSARKHMSLLLDHCSTRELIASERLNFLLTQQYISLAWNISDWLLVCTELLHCNTRRSVGLQFLYSTYLCDSLGRCFLCNARQPRTENLGFVVFHDRLNTYINTYCPNFKTVVFLCQRVWRWFRNHFLPLTFTQKRALRRRFLVTKLII
jgi:hypothetical protein